MPFLRFSSDIHSLGFGSKRIVITPHGLHRKGSKVAGFPVGGSLEFARAIERRYLALGGEIDYKSRVVKILVEADPSGRGDRAVGVRLADGVEHRSDNVISAADGRTTI